MKGRENENGNDSGVGNGGFASGSCEEFASEEAHANERAMRFARGLYSFQGILSRERRDSTQRSEHWSMRSPQAILNQNGLVLKTKPTIEMPKVVVPKEPNSQSPKK